MCGCHVGGLAGGKWKSRRPEKWLRSNDPEIALATVKEAAELAREGSWRLAIQLLVGLQGVSYPMATAYLCALLGGEFQIVDRFALTTFGRPLGDALKAHQVADYVTTVSPKRSCWG